MERCVRKCNSRLMRRGLWNLSVLRGMVSDVWSVCTALVRCAACWSCPVPLPPSRVGRVVC